MPAEPRVLDAWAMMAYLEGEPAGVKGKAMLAEAQGIEGALLASVVNMHEVWYEWREVKDVLRVAPS